MQYGRIAKEPTHAIENAVEAEHLDSLWLSIPGEPSWSQSWQHNSAGALDNAAAGNKELGGILRSMTQ